MKVYAFLPAKGTSERIENKNKKFLCGERLFIRGLKTLLSCKNIDKVFLDTEDEAMYEMVNYLPIEFMHRNAQYANNKTDGNMMFMNEVKHAPDADIYVQFLCTSPFLKPETIDRAIDILKTNADYDSVVLMKKEKLYHWDHKGPLYNKKEVPNSVALPDTITESMGLYVMRREAALENQTRVGHKPYLLFGEPIELIDVDNKEDFELADIIAKGMRQKKQEELFLLKHFISTPMLADLFDDLRVERNIHAGHIISGLKPNIADSKIIGHAKTLKLRKLEEGEDFNGIYDALDSYESISQGDIIIVENEISDYAYFGDLNARIAIKHGAHGVVVGGVTRDIERVSQLGLPVFATGRNAQDVRRRATVAGMNCPVSINGVTIEPNDLILADNDAIAVIREKYQDLVLALVLKILNTEKNIINDIIGKTTEELIKDHGSF